MPEVPGPSGQRAAAAVLAIFKSSSRLLGEVNPVFTEHSITATRFDALDALFRCGGAAMPAELRDMLHLPAQTITGVLDQLQASGLVKRSPHPRDRRSTIAELTRAGREVIDAICPLLVEIEADCMSTLTAAEQDQLITLLGKILVRIEDRRRKR